MNQTEENLLVIALGAVAVVLVLVVAALVAVLW